MGAERKVEGAPIYFQQLCQAILAEGSDLLQEHKQTLLLPREMLTFFYNKLN